MAATPKVTVKAPYQIQKSTQNEPMPLTTSKNGSVLIKCITIIRQDIRDLIKGNRGDWMDYKRFCELARGRKKV